MLMKKINSLKKFFEILPSAFAVTIVLSLGIASSLCAQCAQSSAITIDLVQIGDPGNAPDSVSGHHGAVANVFNIGKTDVTVSQYCAFLNAVAADDTFGLYDPRMGNDAEVPAMIAQEGTSPNFTYSVVGNMGDYPVIYVSYLSKQRFCNWLENGQPSGAEVAGITETGAYSLGSDDMLVAANDGASWRLPTEDECYKAACYQGGLTPDTTSDLVGFRVVGPACAAASSNDCPVDSTQSSVDMATTAGASLSANMASGSAYFASLTPHEKDAAYGVGAVVGVAALVAGGWYLGVPAMVAGCFGGGTAAETGGSLSLQSVSTVSDVSCESATDSSYWERAKTSGAKAASYMKNSASDGCSWVKSLFRGSSGEVVSGGTEESSSQLSTSSTVSNERQKLSEMINSVDDQ